MERGDAPCDWNTSPWGILSLLVIFFIGGGLYFFVLPRFLDKQSGQ